MIGYFNKYQSLFNYGDMKSYIMYSKNMLDYDSESFQKKSKKFNFYSIFPLYPFIIKEFKFVFHNELISLHFLGYMQSLFFASSLFFFCSGSKFVKDSLITCLIVNMTSLPICISRFLPNVDIFYISLIFFSLGFACNRNFKMTSLMLFFSNLTKAQGYIISLTMLITYSISYPKVKDPLLPKKEKQTRIQIIIPLMLSFLSVIIIILFDYFYTSSPFSFLDKFEIVFPFSNFMFQEEKSSLRFYCYFLPFIVFPLLISLPQLYKKSLLYFLINVFHIISTIFIKIEDIESFLLVPHVVSVMYLISDIAYYVFKRRIFILILISFCFNIIICLCYSFKTIKF